MQYYIRTTAAGALATNNGTSYATSWPISKLASFTFSPGDTIYLDGALTGPITFSSSGTSGNPITITSYDLTNIASIDGAGNTANASLRISGAFVNLTSVIVQNNQWAGNGVLQIYSTHDVTVSKCYVTNGYRGIHPKSCTGNIVIDNNWVDNIAHVNGTAITGPASGDGSHIQPDNCSGAGNKVTNNWVWANATGTDGIGDLISLFVSTGTSASNYEVAYNKIRGGGTGTNGYCSIGIGDNSTSTKAYQWIHHNLIAGAKYAGMQIAGGDTINVDSNTVYVPQYVGHLVSSKQYGSLMAVSCYNASPQTPINVTFTNNKLSCHDYNNNINNYYLAAGVATPTGWASTGSGNTAATVSDPAATDSIIPGPNLWTGTPWNAAALAAPVITYNAANRYYTVGVTITTQLPTNTGGTAASFSVSPTLPSGLSFDTTTGAISGTPTTFQNPVTYTITATNSGGTGTTTQAISVANATLTFGALPTKTYGDVDFAPGATGTGTITYSSGNTSVATIVSGNIHIVGAGTAVITASNGTTATQTLTVNKAGLAVTAASFSKTYGAANPTFTLSYSGFVNSETATNLTTQPTVSCSATTSSPVGSYATIASGGVSSNYSFSYVAGTLTINKAPLTITASSASMTYCGTVPTITASYTGFVNGDTSAVLSPGVTISAGTTSGNPVGTYTSTVSGAGATNYTIGYVSGTVTVNKATLTATADPKSRVFNTANPTLTITYTGFLNGDNVLNLSTVPTATTSATTSSAVGTYSIVPSGGAASNYTFSYVNGTLTITTPPFSFPAITPVSYGASDFDPGATSSNTITYTSSNTAVATIVANKIHVVSAGTSSITATDGVTTQANTLTVNKAVLTVTADTHIMAQGTSVPALTLTYSGFIGSETTANLTTLPTASTTATNTSAVGTYSIIPSGGSATNYSFSYVTGAMIVVSGTVIHINIPVTLLL